MKLIDRDTLVAEIRRMIKNSELYIEHHRDNNNRLRYSFEHQRLAMYELLSFIDTLEVKDVDLEKHLKEDIEDVFFDLNGVAIKGATHYLTVEDVKDIAKHFFELGLQARIDKELVEEHCTETEFREIEILRTKLSDIAKAIYYHEGKENPTVERIREIVQDCCFELMDLKKPKQEEPASEDLKEAAKNYADNITDKIGYKLQLRRAVVYGAKWQKQQDQKEIKL